MRDASECFWNASLEEMKRGYIEEENCYVCLLCGQEFQKGIIYPEEGILYEVERYVRVHIEKVHQSVFNYLIEMDKKLTGLTDHQKSLLKLFYQGKNDKEIQEELGIGSASTIRNHRFVLKEKERQARVYLAMMELLKEKDQYAPAFIDPHQTARMIDDRYNVTREEYNELVKKYFPEDLEGRLSAFAQKEKHRLVVLREIVKRFELDQNYSETEVNQILEAVYDDYVMMRRYLIEYGFLDRKPDGSRYWVKKG
ncbi:MAG: DUF2087 domain-containing protein [Bacillota bacterium]|nr:DUF2087 domain-containing protein [Bacillota bacterium]